MALWSAVYGAPGKAIYSAPQRAIRKLCKMAPSYFYEKKSSADRSDRVTLGLSPSFFYIFCFRWLQCLLGRIMWILALISALIGLIFYKLV